jgi:adenine-specific DNA-methyltransferase
LKLSITQLYKLILNNPEVILEPSVGRGDLVQAVLNKQPNISFDYYELDNTIQLLDCIERDKLVYGDFLKQTINKLYKTIIGNPPYIKTKSGNLYIDFIDKCIGLLQDNGELIFIIPSDFLKLTSSGNVINKMLSSGMITHIIHPHNENLFEEASIDIIIRYIKNHTQTYEQNNKLLYNNNEKYLINTNGIITFSDTPLTQNKYPLNKYFNIYVGIVSGKESVFKNTEYGNINVLTAKDKVEKYILIQDYPTDNPDLNRYLMNNKTDLINRKIRKFTESNWYEWGALRNYKKIEDNNGRYCIYISNITRKLEVAFKGKVQHFGGGLIILIPKADLEIDINLDKLVKYFNSEKFKKNYMYSGRFKIGHKQLSNSLINPEEINGL